MKRACGVLMPVSCLPSGFSCGCFGEGARGFIDKLADGGFSYWQVLPFSVVDAFHSPYSSPSAFSGNPWLLDLADFREKGWLTEEEWRKAREEIGYTCEFERLERERMPLLSRVAARANERDKIEAFWQAHPYSEEFCRFMALSSANGGLPWRAWREQKINEDVLYTWGFSQMHFFSQWENIRDYAAQKGVRIIGDLPIYVAYESADVYFHPALFDLDEEGRMRGVAGVPPDYFSEDGQLWGNPLYRWDKMAEDGYAWWQDRVRHSLALFDGVRLDHFRGFDTYYRIPAGAETAREGSWQKGPGCPFIDMLRETFGQTLFIAEDLGEKMSTVEALLAYSGFPGMRVFSFAFEGESNSAHLPHEYPENAVAYTGTHDNNTLLGYLYEISDQKRKEIFRYCRYGGALITEGCRAVMETLYASHAGLLILPIQDLLFFGEDTRVNTPGRAEGNWGFRVTETQLASLDTAYFSALARRYGRSN